MRKLIFLSSLAIGCIVCWQIGARVNIAHVLPIAFLIMGMAIGAVAAAIAVAEPKERNVGEYTQDTEKATVQPTALVVQPERWFVIEPTVMILPTATHGKLEVGR